MACPCRESLLKGLGAISPHTAAAGSGPRNLWSRVGRHVTVRHGLRVGKQGHITFQSARLFAGSAMIYTERHRSCCTLSTRIFACVRVRVQPPRPHFRPSLAQHRTFIGRRTFLRGSCWLFKYPFRNAFQLHSSLASRINIFILFPSSCCYQRHHGRQRYHQRFHQGHHQ